MTDFIGDDNVTLDVSKIIYVHWKRIDIDGFYYAEINLIEGHQITLYYHSDDDYWMINNLRDNFGYEDLPRLK